MGRRRAEQEEEQTRDEMESKDGVHAASRQWNSAQRSPHRTSSFHHIRRSNSGELPLFASYLPFVSDSILLSVRAFLMPGISRPLPPVRWFPSGPGRA